MATAEICEEDQRIDEPRGCKARHHGRRDGVALHEGERPHDYLQDEGRNNNEATARRLRPGVCAPGALTPCTMRFATVKKPSGIGDALSRKTIRVIC
jgi:hypothetical protein